MSATCTYDGCTVAETGRCALERDPATCSYRVGNGGEGEANAITDDSTASADASAPVLKSPDENPRFPSSLTLGLEETEKMMRSRYTTVVGILGEPESGKTACLASLYLLVSNAMLDGWSFADSRSLMAFEEIARGARRWDEGNPPEQMTIHTESGNDREPGFLHLRLRRNADNRVVDLALPDLPGEWTKALMRSARSDRFEFLKSADSIWLVIDGRVLADRELRRSTIVRLGQLAGRLTTLIEGTMPRLLMVVTHRDASEPDHGAVAQLEVELAKYELRFKLMPVASFSNNPNLRAGFGLCDLIAETVGEAAPPSTFWPTRPPTPSVSSFLSYRRNQ